MSLFVSVNALAADFVAAEGPVPNDGVGSTSLHPIFPPIGELIAGSLASIIIFGAIYKFAGPMVKKSFSDRTARIQKELDDSSAAAAAAEAEAVRIRSAKGDIDAERSRLYADADVQAEALLADGRERLAAEMADLEVRAEAELASAAGRSGDELRSEIARYSAGAIDSVVNGTLDDAAQQDLIEGFIARVGAQSGVTS
jgi:F-type H+-transporting ATPase subunit b